MAALYLGLVSVVCLFIFWRSLRRLGFATQPIFDLILIASLSALVFGNLFGHGAPVFVPAAYLFGLLSFFWYVNRRKWSVFEVGDRLAIPLSLGLLALTAWQSHGRMVSSVVISLLILIIALVSFKIKAVRGWRLFIFVLLSLPVLYDKSTYTLTFLAALAILSSLGIWSRFRSKTIKAPMDLMAQLKDKLFKKEADIKEAQLHLPQDDPFLVKGREDDNAPEDEVDEQLGHDQIIAEASFLARAKAQVDKALGRVKSGKYGTCERCGKSIDKARLTADPSATLCIKCALKAESTPTL